MLGRVPSEGIVKGSHQLKLAHSSKTSSPAPFSKTPSVESDDKSRLQEILTDALVSPVTEEARKKVHFIEGPTSQVESEANRDFARKNTPFVRKEDIPEEAYGLKICTDESSEGCADESHSKFREERKATGFIRVHDLPDESDTESHVEEE